MLNQKVFDLWNEIVCRCFECVSLTSNCELFFHFLRIGFENSAKIWLNDLNEYICVLERVNWCRWCLLAHRRVKAKHIWWNERESDEEEKDNSNLSINLNVWMRPVSFNGRISLRRIVHNSIILFGIEPINGFEDCFSIQLKLVAFFFAFSSDFVALICISTWNWSEINRKNASNVACGRLEVSDSIEANK